MMKAQTEKDKQTSRSRPGAIWRDTRMAGEKSLIDAFPVL